MQQQGCDSLYVARSVNLGRDGKGGVVPEWWAAPVQSLLHLTNLIRVCAKPEPACGVAGRSGAGQGRAGKGVVGCGKYVTKDLSMPHLKPADSASMMCL